ncbi:MAG: thioredoxin domain-containing protein, partial [Acidobacteriota bacterium]
AWCMPCRMVAPVIEELADEMAGKVRFGKLDIDSDQQLASDFKIQGVPTFILFANNEEKGRLVGNMPKQAFEDFLAQHAN